jgi:hypothetical protein
MHICELDGQGSYGQHVTFAGRTEVSGMFGQVTACCQLMGLIAVIAIAVNRAAGMDDMAVWSICSGDVHKDAKS